MRLHRQVVCMFALCVSAACARTYKVSQETAAETAHRTWPRRHEESADQLDEKAFAWVVQTGKESAEEAVAAIMVTFLQQAAAHAGFVADVEAVGKVKLADTGHMMERWSLAHWEDEWRQDSLGSEQAAETGTDSLRPQRPSYPHGAHKVLPGFNLMHAKWPDASWHVMVDDDTFVFRRSLANLLSDLDPEGKHYIGYPRQGAHMCKIPTKLGISQRHPLLLAAVA